MGDSDGCSSPPAATSSPWAALARRRSAACLRYSQFAHPAHANVARINNTTPMTIVFLFNSFNLFYLIVRAGRRLQNGRRSRLPVVGSKPVDRAPSPYFAAKLLPSETDESHGSRRLF